MEYTNSPLAKVDVDFGTKNSNPRKNTTYNKTGAITKITIHHMAGVMTAKACAQMHYKSSGSSANYYIGNNGEISLGVPESRRAWTSSSRANDYNAITIEVSNSKNGGDWPVSDAAFNACIELCKDICKRNNISKLEYTGDAKGSLTRHNMFARTACPGPYLQARFPEIADKVNGKVSEPVQETTEKPNTEKLQSYTVKITAKVLNVRKGPGTNYPVVATVKKNQVYTIVGEEMNGKTKWGMLKSGAGYISLDYTKKN